MEGDMDEEITWRSAKFLYPDPSNSKVVVSNPDYHPPISYRKGKFWDEDDEEIPKDQIPPYILERLKDRKQEKPIVNAHGSEYTMKEIMEGKSMLSGEALTIDIRRAQAAARKKEKAKAKKPKKRTKKCRLHVDKKE
jgi:hypothetical protein